MPALVLYVFYFYLKHMLKNERIKDCRAFWIICLVLFSYVTVFIYWYQYIYKDGSSPT
jgi:hypothetical protein